MVLGSGHLIVDYCRNILVPRRNVAESAVSSRGSVGRPLSPSVVDEEKLESKAITYVHGE